MKSTLFVIFALIAIYICASEPQHAVAGPLWGYVQNYPLSSQISYSCLQGIVNRSLPKEIYLDDFNGTITQEHKDREWFQTIYGSDYPAGAQLTDDLGAFCFAYEHYIKGWVLFDPNNAWEVNAVTTVAAALDYVPLTTDWYNNLVSRGVIEGKPVLDYRDRWTSAQACYTEMYSTYFSQCSAPFVALADPSSENVRDYYVYARAFTFYFDNTPGNATHPVSSSLINTILSQSSKMYAVGWALPESTSGTTTGFVNYVSQNNKWVIPASPWGPRNLSFLNQYQTQPAAQSQGTAITAVNGKVYIGFIVSDGDNASMEATYFKERWKDTARGQIPLGWSFSPWFSEHMAPCYLNWFMNNKSSNDYFVGAVSGTGYCYLEELSPSFRSSYLAQTSTDLAAYGMQVGWTLNVNEPLSDTVAGNFIDATGVLGLFGDYSGDGSYKVWHNAMYIHSINTYTTDQTQVYNSIVARGNALPTSSPGFIMVTCDGFGITPTMIQNMIAQLGPRYVPLRPDVLCKTYLKIYGYPY